MLWYNKLKVKESQSQIITTGDDCLGISDRIEAFIIELLKNDENYLEIGRNELASVFNCVPSQINYVISTRFNADKGYIVESKRGGGGYLRIKKVIPNDDDLLYNCVVKIGAKIDYNTSKALVSYLLEQNEIDKTSYELILAAISDKSIPPSTKDKDIIRANILKNMLITLI